MSLVLSNIVLVLCIIYLCITARHGLHILQLDHYYTDSYLRWMKANSHQIFSVRKFAVLLVPIVIFALNAPKIAYALTILSYIVLIIESIVTRVPEKKSFVVTGRVVRQFITYIIIFLILIGIVNNFNDIYTIFVLNLLAALTYILVYLVATVNKPIEKLINNRYCRKAKKKIKSMPNFQVVGITGSYGKTSVKYIVDTILSQKYNTLKTPESYNTTMGVVKTINNDLKPIHNMFVCEMGAKYVGDVKEICNIVHPNYGVVTAIGPQHLETFKTIENVSKTKMELVDSLDEDGIAFVNWEDENIRKVKTSKKLVKYGLKSDSDYYAENVKMNERGSMFDVVMPGNRKISVKTKLLGRLNILNIVGGVAVADKLGLTEEQIKTGISYIKPVEHRLELKQNPNGSIIIDDAYNSNIRGFDMALEVLGAFTDKKKILITPGIVDLGEWSFNVNKAIGKEATKHTDYIIFVGEKQAEPMVEGVKETKFPKKNMIVAKNLDEALKEMNKLMDSNTVVLLENDLPDNYL